MRAAAEENEKKRVGAYKRPAHLEHAFVTVAVCSVAVTEHLHVCQSPAALMEFFNLTDIDNIKIQSKLNGKAVRTNLTVQMSNAVKHPGRKKHFL